MCARSAAGLSPGDPIDIRALLTSAITPSPSSRISMRSAPSHLITPWVLVAILPRKPSISALSCGPAESAAPDGAAKPRHSVNAAAVDPSLVHIFLIHPAPAPPAPHC